MCERVVQVSPSCDRIGGSQSLSSLQFKIIHFFEKINKYRNLNPDSSQFLCLKAQCQRSGLNHPSMRTQPWGDLCDDVIDRPAVLPQRDHMFYSSSCFGGETFHSLTKKKIYGEMLLYNKDEDFYILQI